MKSMVTLEDFNRLDIRIGKVLSVEKVPDAEKLLKFIFDLGEEKRQIIAGMAEFYSEPSILEGKEMPLLLNIEPRTFRGQVSEGMIIAADVDGRPVLLHPEREISREASSARSLIRPKDQAFRRLATMMQALAR